MRFWKQSSIENVETFCNKMMLWIINRLHSLYLAQLGIIEKFDSFFFNFWIIYIFLNHPSRWVTAWLLSVYSYYFTVEVSTFDRANSKFVHQQSIWLVEFQRFTGKLYNTQSNLTIDTWILFFTNKISIIPYNHFNWRNGISKIISHSR